MRVEHCVYAARALRDFGDGLIAVVLPAYLLSLGLSAFQVGVVATLALLGSALLTLAAGLAVRWSHRQLLLGACTLMSATGIAYSMAGDYALLLVVAFVGTINPSAGGTSVFVPLEHAVLSGAVDARRRTHAFARYSLLGALAGACGALAAGAPDWLAAAGWTERAAFQALFLGYAGLGIAGALLYRKLPRLQDAQVRPPAPLGPSKRTVYRLAALFSVDSFAGGLVV